MIKINQLDTKTNAVGISDLKMVLELIDFLNQEKINVDNVELEEYVNQLTHELLNTY